MVLNIQSQTETKLVMTNRPGMLSYIVLVPSSFCVLISGFVLWSVFAGMSVLSLECTRQSKKIIAVKFTTNTF